MSLKKCDAEDDEVIEARVRMKGQEKQCPADPEEALVDQDGHWIHSGEAVESACLNYQSSHTKTTLCASVTVISKGSGYCP